MFAHAPFLQDRSKIRSHYLSFWFWIDLLAIAPIWVTNYIVDERALETGTDKSAGDMLQILRMVRLLRLVKISRVVKASRIFKRFEQTMEVSYGALGMFKLMIFLFSWSHLQSCFWGLVPQLFGEPYSWTDALDGCDAQPCPPSSLTPWDKYVAGLYFSIMTVTSIGYGEMLPVNTTERVICSILMLSSSIVWCYVMGQACSIAATLDPAAIEFKANIDALNVFMRERGLPKTLKVALRTYFHNSRRLQRLTQDNNLISLMSPLMQSTVALQANKDWLDRIWYLRSEWYSDSDAERIHSAFIAALAQKLMPSAHVGQERIAGGLLCIVNRGLAIKRWRFLSPGKAWGEDMILENPAMIDYSEAVAMTYLEIYTLDRPALDAVCRQFPPCAARLRKAARRMLIQRVVVRGMRQQAGLPPPKSFEMPTGEQNHALPPVSLEQKVDILVQSSAVATHKLMIAEGHTMDDDDAGGDAQGIGVGVATAAAADGGPGGKGASGDSALPVAQAEVVKSGGAAGGSDSGGGGFWGGGGGALPTISSDSTTNEIDASAASASFDRLLAMYQDVAALQAAMGDELNKLSATLGRSGSRVAGSGLPQPRPPSNRNQPSSRGVSLALRPKGPRSAPGAMKAIDEAGEEQWLQSARKFLPPWAQPGSPDSMSA